MSIDLTIIIDAEKVVAAAGGGPSTPTNTSPTSPGGCNHNWAFMMTHVSNAVSGNGTADLVMTAPVGETIHVSSVSMSNQQDYAVFVYDFAHWKGDTVLDTAGMKNRTINRLAVIPTPDQADHAPPNVTFQDQNFYIEQIDVNSSGQEYFYVTFVVYGPPSSGKRPVLGYFRWDPSIKAE